MQVTDKTHCQIKGENMVINVGSDFSGVGAFNQAIIRLGISYKEVFACDMDKYARQTFVHNYGEPDYYPENVYDREIPKETLDIYMTSPPCQAFSLAGKRKGEDDKRGILFYNSHEFIKGNKPRYFIFENVKGLLSDDNGNTFAKWIQYLGGKSVNGNHTLFPHEESLPYHIYWKVLNAKDYNIPQNRERVFIIGIRDDEDNNFAWPKEMFLERRLRDVLESYVDEKYYLSDKMLELLTYGKVGSTEIANINKGGQKGSVVSEDGSHIGCLSATDYKLPKLVQVKSATKQGYEIAGGGQDPKILVAKRQRTEEGKNIRRHNRMKGRDSNPFQCKQTTYEESNIMNCLGTSLSIDNQISEDRRRIRKLTPRECFRLMDFPDTFSWPVSDTQAYKQAGNSICVGVLAAIISRFNLSKS